MFFTGNGSIAQNNKNCQQVGKSNSQVIQLIIESLSVGSNNFVEWLEGEMKARNWRPAELAQAAGLYSATLSRVLSGDRQPGPDFCVAVAKAFSVPPDTVFRLAGLLPPVPTSEREPTLQELYELLKNMTVAERAEILEYSLFKYQRRRN